MLIASLIICCLILDFTLIGFIPKTFNIWPSLEDLIPTKQQLDKLEFHTFETDIEGKFRNSMFEKRYQYTVALLTNDFFIIKNTLLTYLFSVPNHSIESYKIKKTILGKKLIFYVNIEGKQHYIKILPINLRAWISKVSEMGFPEIK